MTFADSAAKIGIRDDRANKPSTKRIVAITPQSIPTSLRKAFDIR
jgi:hypothetical protein